MFQSARHRSPMTPRWVRGLMTGAFSGRDLHHASRLRSRLRLPQHLAAAPHGMVVRLADPPVAVAAARGRHQARRARQGADPRPDSRPSALGAACLDPPSEEEVWNKVPKFKNGCPSFYETQRNNVRILIEKIGEKIDPCKIYPLAGPCQLVHCHYKCTVYYDELYWSDYPIPFNHVDHKVEVVYIDKDHLRRCGGPAQRRSTAGPDRREPDREPGNVAIASGPAY